MVAQGYEAGGHTGEIGTMVLVPEVVDAVAPLPDAPDAFEADAALVAVLGAEFCQSFRTYRRNEVERFERHVTDWEFTEYAYHL